MDREVRELICAVEEALENQLNEEDEVEREAMIDAGHYLIWLIKNIIELKEQELDKLDSLE